MQALHDPLRLPVDRQRPPGHGVEHHHANRRGFDQGFEIGPSPLLGSIGLGVGDGRCRLGSKQLQHGLILVPKLRAAFLFADEGDANLLAAMHQGRCHEGRCRDEVLGKAERLDVARHIPQPQRPLHLAKMLE